MVRFKMFYLCVSTHALPMNTVHTARKLCILNLTQNIQNTFFSTFCSLENNRVGNYYQITSWITFISKSLFAFAGKLREELASKNMFVLDSAANRRGVTPHNTIVM